MEEPLKPEVMATQSAEESAGTPDVTQPTKLIRIASMTRAMLEEARQASLDEGGRKRMATVHARSVKALKEVLSPELEEEFEEIMIPLNDGGVSEAELRVAQAQLIGWLEGLFHGIQASLWSQQMNAQTQLAEMQKRGIAAPRQEGQSPSGPYL